MPKSSSLPERPDAAATNGNCDHAMRLPALSSPPGDPTTRSSGAEGRTDQNTRQTLTYACEHFGGPITRGEIAVSENCLIDLFLREMGVSLSTYLNRYRITHAKNLLVNTEEKVTENALRVGFNDPAYFSRVFWSDTGRSPAFRNAPPSGEATGA